MSLSSVISGIQIAPEFFPDDYHAGRNAWRKISAQLAAGKHYSETLQFSDAHPDTTGTAPTTDCLWLGPENADSVLVLISGTHGVEGFVGSAVQQFFAVLLQQQAVTLPADTALLFVHALNPWGFDWLRRGDADGVDLNRNFIDFSNPPAPHPAFARLQPLLYETDHAKRLAGLQQLERELGRVAYEIALSGGQYVDAGAPFYGGTRPCHGRQVIEQLMAHHQLANRTLLVLDIHSGLGPWGYGELICDHPADSDGTRSAQRIFGADLALPDLGTSCSVPKLGLQDYAWHAIMNPRSCFLTLEFGSYGTEPLFDCLIDEQQAHGTLDNNQWLHSKTAARQKEHFCPGSAYWRRGVLFRAMQVIDQGLQGVAHG